MENDESESRMPAAAVEDAGRLFGRNVRMHRRGMGWSQAELAERLSAYYGMQMHQTTVAKLENATRPSTISELVALAQLFRTEPADLLSDFLDNADLSSDLERLREMAADTERELANLAVFIEALEAECEEAKVRLYEKQARLQEASAHRSQMLGRYQYFTHQIDMLTAEVEARGEGDDGEH